MTDENIAVRKARESLRDAVHDWHACRDTEASESSFDAWKAAEEHYERTVRREVLLEAADEAEEVGWFAVALTLRAKALR